MTSQSFLLSLGSIGGMNVLHTVESRFHLFYHRDSLCHFLVIWLHQLHEVLVSSLWMSLNVFFYGSHGHALETCFESRFSIFLYKLCIINQVINLVACQNRFHRRMYWSPFKSSLKWRQQYKSLSTKNQCSYSLEFRPLLL